MDTKHEEVDHLVCQSVNQFGRLKAMESQSGTRKAIHVDLAYATMSPMMGAIPVPPGVFSGLS